LEFREFAESMGLKLFNSSPYYAQANGQAEASNEIMIKLSVDAKFAPCVKHTASRTKLA
jgi:hypothetical protein